MARWHRWNLFSPAALVQVCRALGAFTTLAAYRHETRRRLIYHTCLISTGGTDMLRSKRQQHYAPQHGAGFRIQVVRLSSAACGKRDRIGVNLAVPSEADPQWRLPHRGGGGRAARRGSRQGRGPARRQRALARGPTPTGRAREARLTGPDSPG